MLVTQKALGECLGISARRIRQLKESGLFEGSMSDKRYKLEPCIKEYIEYRVNAETGRRTSEPKERVQARHEEVKLQISALKLRKMRHEVHESTDVELFLSDMLLRFRRRLMEMPTKLALLLAGQDDVGQITETIKKEVLGALEELSEYDPDKIGEGDGDGAWEEDGEEEEDGGEDDTG